MIRPIIAVVFALCSCSVSFDPTKAISKCSAMPPANPETLEAKIAETSVIEWSWPVVERAELYRFCTSVPGGTEQCRDVVPAEACTASNCTVRDEGLTVNVRVSARVQAVDDCGLESTSATAPTVSATPLSFTKPDSWVAQTGCSTAPITNVVGGLISIEQSGWCSTTLVTGDELWGDFTLDADVRISAISGNGLTGGITLFSNSAGHRLIALAAGAMNGDVDPAVLRERDGNQERTVASSIHVIPEGVFTHFRITSKQGIVSWQLGSGSELPEIIRWPDSLPRVGRIGIAASGGLFANAGRIEVQNFVLRTSAALVARGPVSLKLDFADGGYTSQTRARNAPITVVPCPAYASDCVGACAPPPGSRCAQFNYLSVLGVDAPPGLDSRLPWTLAMRFAPAQDAGFVSILNSRDKPVLFAGPNETWGLETSYGRTLSVGKWHTAEWKFEPDAGRFSLTLDGRETSPASTTFPGPNGAHLGAFRLGPGDFYLSELNISQTP